MTTRFKTQRVHMKEGTVIGVSNPKRPPIIQRVGKVWRIWTDYHPNSGAGTVLLLRHDGSIEKQVITSDGDVDWSVIVKEPE